MKGFDKKHWVGFIYVIATLMYSGFLAFYSGYLGSIYGLIIATLDAAIASSVMLAMISDLQNVTGNGPSGATAD